MPEPAYSVLEIQPEWVLEREALGSKRKFWYRATEDEPQWLFKYPQPNAGQHWSEKIAAEVAAGLEILHARVELAVFQGTRGSATESFAREGRNLFHGNQILAGAIFWDRSDKRGLSPLELVRRAAGLHPELFQSALARLERLDRQGLETIVGRVPGAWMTPLAREFAVELMCYNTEQLRRIAP